MKEFVIAFVGQVVPDTPEFNIPGFGRAGNLAQIGFLEALHSAGLAPHTVLSSQPVAYFPRSRIILKRTRSVELFAGVAVTLVPLVNLYLVRDILRALYIYGRLFAWSLRHVRKERVVLTYNLNVPPVLPLLFLARLTGLKLVSILYDITWPESLKLGSMRVVAYKTLIKVADWCIPRLDGRIVIADSIARHYAPDKHALRVDGGLTELVLRRLFPLVPVQGETELALLFAGGLDEWNHLPLLLEVMRQNPGQGITLWLAGDGRCLAGVLDAAKNDARIVYHGVLAHEQLFELYKKADVLLNLRNTADPAMCYAFPSKLLEILAVGKPVITTSIAHVKEEYGPYCFVLPEETPQALMALIRGIMALSSEERMAVGRRAREFMLREHTWKKQGMRIREYLENKVLG